MSYWWADSESDCSCSERDGIAGYVIREWWLQVGEQVGAVVARMGLWRACHGCLVGRQSHRVCMQRAVGCVPSGACMLCLEA